jgi:hypothetical protein
VGTGGNASVVGNVAGTGNILGNTTTGNANVITVGNTTGGTGNVITIGTGGNGNANIGNIGGTGNTVGNTIGNTTGNITGNTIGNVTGNITGTILATDASTAYNPTTKTFFGTIGSTSARAIVYGDIVGSVSGTATTADTLGAYSPSISTAPETVAIRDTSGRLTAAGFLGTATFADRIKIDNTAVDGDPSYRSAKTTPEGLTIAARDSSGNLSAVLFEGTATAARYADLAEKYLTDKEYGVGTVVMIGGEKEVTATTGFGDRAIGVVSANPAFMMNKDLEGGTYIALKGRVPVRVVGAVAKGQRLIASSNGCAVGAVPHANDVFAIALETNSDISEKIIEAVVL